ncbi:hypothetical protein BgiBS90_024274 [Biomphalaria glabrata]|nr:hypothetical protein BgiBS90_024274 [Biomphalaria glabrata]
MTQSNTFLTLSHTTPTWITLSHTTLTWMTQSNTFLTLSHTTPTRMTQSNTALTLSHTAPNLDDAVSHSFGLVSNPDQKDRVLNTAADLDLSLIQMLPKYNIICITSTSPYFIDLRL